MIPTHFAVAILAICLTWLITALWKKNSRLPPGPWGLPFLGYYPFLSQQPYIDFAKLTERYGKVFSFRTVGGKLIVVLNGVETIKEILVNRSEEFIGRPEEYNLLEWISDGLGVTQEDGSVWREHRHFFIKTLKNLNFGTQDTEIQIQEEITALLSDIRRTKGDLVDFSYHIAYAVNSVICPVLFSKKFEKYSKEFDEIFKSACHLVELFVDRRFFLVGFIYKYITMKMLPSTRKNREGKSCFRSIIKAIVDEHVKTFNPDNIRDYIDSYLYEAHKLSRSDGTAHSFTMERLNGIAINMLMEGTETVAGTITCMLMEISQHQVQQNLVQEELDHVVGRERLPVWKDRQNLPYFNAFIKELCRVRMPFDVSTYYSNFEQTTIQSHLIPKRSILVANLWTINNDPSTYPQPWKFDPSRFLNQNENKTKEPCIFGIGKRTCIVPSLAQKEIFLIIASILQSFTIFPSDKDKLLRAIPRM